MLASKLKLAEPDTNARVRRHYDVLITWLIVHGIAIVSLLTYHTSTTPTIAGRYSLQFLITIGAIAGWAIGSVVFFIWLTHLSDERFAALLGGFGRLRTRAGFRMLVILVAAFGIALYWLRFPDILEDVPHPYLRFVWTIAIFGILYIGLFWRALDPIVRWPLWVLLGAVAMVGALAIAIGLTASIHRWTRWTRSTITSSSGHTHILAYSATGHGGRWCPCHKSGTTRRIG